MSALLQHWVTVVCSPNELLVFKLVRVPAQEAGLRSQSILAAKVIDNIFAQSFSKYIRSIQFS
jgi:hypothetical protein